MRVKSIAQIKGLAGKTVFLRADLNVPVKGGKVKEDFKIAASLPTIRFLLRQGCSLVIATHLNNGLSARPAANRLATMLGRKVIFTGQVLGKKTEAAVKKIKPGQIIFLENLRFDAEEEKNGDRFARGLAGLADLYVNDAFAVDHRAHASLSAIKKYLPSYAGLLLEKEVIKLSAILKPRRPLVSILGGAKIETKLGLLNALAKKSYRVLVGGALANDFLAARGDEVGRSVLDRAGIKAAKSMLKKYKNIVLPIDVVVAGKKDGAVAAVKSADQVGKKEMILDIGPKTIRLFAGLIKKANTLIWNGPMGYFENPHFKHGTLAVARLLAERSTGPAFGAAGGGETVEALKMTKMEDYLDLVSTGGGAMLAFLAGEKMPGLKGLVK